MTIRYWFEKAKAFVKQETVLSAAVVMAVISSLFYRPRLVYIDWEVLCVLWALMLVVAGLKSVRFLDWSAVELLQFCSSKRQITLVLVGITFVSSMFVTNDVALLTFVPLALVIGKAAKMDMPLIIILQTLAANLGSMFTPAGNPQNLFLYAHYNFTAEGFFSIMLLPTLLSVAYILFIIYNGRDRKLSLQLQRMECPERRITAIYLALLFFNIAAVLHFVDKYAALAVTVIAVLLMNRKLLVQVDYSLLVTFIGFFIFIGNISHTDIVRFLQDNVLDSATGTYLAALISSQLISNVPAAMLLAALTKEAEALLLGVNIGGLGTLIASMASVISYKLFAAEHPYQAGNYLKTFLFYNFLGLLLIGTAVYFLFIWKAGV